MISLLSKIFIKKQDTMKPDRLRQAYGTLCCIVGILLNVLLFGGKYFAGIATGSIAITADAFNNLSDAGSSVITLAGLRLADKKPDIQHPFGHGRLEYLSGLAVSVIIIVVGVELFRSSVSKIINPSDVDTSVPAMIILIASIIVKGYMYIYNMKIGKKIDSSGMKATAIDSIGDTVATFVVLISTVITYFTDIHIDGWCGLVVAMFIIYAGISSAKDTISPLLGGSPDKDFVDSIKKITMSYDEIIGIHDLIVHDYGPGRIMVSLHAEVNGNGDIFELHDVIDNAEHRLTSELGCVAVIHMDPIETDDAVTSKMRIGVASAVKEIDKDITIHDFRLVPGVTHTNLIFDVLVPFSVKLSDDEIKSEIDVKVKKKYSDCNTVINVDRPFV